MFEERLLKLENTGSKSYKERDKLKYLIQNDLGHINHNNKKTSDTFFCYKCGTKLFGDPTDTECCKCGTIIKYTNTSRNMVLNNELKHSENSESIIKLKYHQESQIWQKE
jgi:hypothetical protein